MRVLYVTSFSGKRINSFMESAFIAAKNLGYQITLAANFDSANKDEYLSDSQKYNFKILHVPFQHSPMSKKNYQSYKVLLNHLRNETYDIIHCNTAIGGFVTRMVCKKLQLNNIIYQAHGFHFYKGSPLRYWLIYYPIERYLSKFTNTLVVINNYDFKIARNKMKTKEILLSPGVGVNLDFYKLPKQHNNDEKIHLFSCGELVKNKNHITILKAIKNLDNVVLYIAGEGSFRSKLEKYIRKHDMELQVHLLGYRHDIPFLLSTTDIFIFPSYWEGLPAALMQAMAAELPCLVSDIRGNNDLIISDQGGYLFKPDDYRRLRKLIIQLSSSKKIREQFGAFNSEYVKNHDLKKAIEFYENLYQRQGNKHEES